MVTLGHIIFLTFVSLTTIFMGLRILEKQILELKEEIKKLKK
jgi:hypothetical protein